MEAIIDVDKERKKQFCLDNLRGYLTGKEKWGVDRGGCCYFVEGNGAMCVAGRNMINPKNWDGLIMDILTQDETQSCFKEESRGILEIGEWSLLQNIHDKLGMNSISEGKYSEWDIQNACIQLGLFTYEELMALKG